MAYTTINKYTDFFNTVTYTATSGTTSVTGVTFQPDLIWAKDRGRAENPPVYDSVRGAGKRFLTSVTTAENDEGSNGISFDADGFTTGQDGSSGQDGENYVAWNWKAGTTSGLSGGTITPSAYSINTTAGFGIYKRTGTATAGTIAHGLGDVPKFIISKNLSSGSNIRCYHVSRGNTKCINLNEQNAEETNSMWNDTTPTSTVYSIGSNNDGNKSGDTFIDYVFCEKRGYSKFNNYVGNNNATRGAFAYTGFKPAFILLKDASGSSDWQILDNKREGYNPDNDRIKANSNQAEDSTDYLDILSNGFKIYSTSGDYNTDGNVFIYAAFGQSIVGTNQIPTTAR